MSVALLADIIRGACAMTSVPLSLRIVMGWCFIIEVLIMHKYTTLYVQKYGTSKLINIKSDDVSLLLQKVMLLTIYIQTKALKSPDYTNKFGYFRL